MSIAETPTQPTTPAPEAPPATAGAAAPAAETKPVDPPKPTAADDSKAWAAAREAQRLARAAEEEAKRHKSRIAELERELPTAKQAAAFEAGLRQRLSAKDFGAIDELLEEHGGFQGYLAWKSERAEREAVDPASLEERVMRKVQETLAAEKKQREEAENAALAEREKQALEAMTSHVKQLAAADESRWAFVASDVANHEEIRDALKARIEKSGKRLSPAEYRAELEKVLDDAEKVLSDDFDRREAIRKRKQPKQETPPAEPATETAPAKRNPFLSKRKETAEATVEESPKRHPWAAYRR